MHVFGENILSKISPSEKSATSSRVTHVIGKIKIGEIFCRSTKYKHYNFVKKFHERKFLRIYDVGI